MLMKTQVPGPSSDSLSWNLVLAQESALLAHGMGDSDFIYTCKTQALRTSTVMVSQKLEPWVVQSVKLSI